MSRLGASDLAGLEAGGAYVEALGSAAHENAHLLNVRHPAAVGATVGMGDGVTVDRSLAADFAVGRHGALPLRCKSFVA